MHLLCELHVTQSSVFQMRDRGSSESHVALARLAFERALRLGQSGHLARDAGRVVAAIACFAFELLRVLDRARISVDRRCGGEGGRRHQRECNSKQ